MLNEQEQKLLNNLIQLEHVSSILYLAMSAHMANRNFVGAAKWLRLQSEEERTHMLTLFDYLIDRGGRVEIQQLPAQPYDFGTPLETFTKVLEHEQYVTNTYRQAFNFANQNDPQTGVILQDFLREQIDEEAQAKTIIDRLTMAGNNPSALLMIDQELGQRNGAAAAPPAAPAGG